MSKIQVDEIYDLDGTGAPLLPKGAVVTGVLTATSYDGDGSNLQNITLPVDANISTTGIITATSFSGDGSNLSNVTLGTSASVNTTGIITATSFSGDGSGLVFAPKVIAFDPAALSTGAAITTNITITFDQNIYFSGSGTIEIRQGSISGTILESFAITSGTPASGLNISGTQLIINPTSNLAQGANIYVILPSSGITNTEGISYAGSNNYNFQTESAGFTAQGGDVELNLIDPTSPTGYYKYHIFTTSGILTTSQNTANADSFSFMMIGGGGGGNRANTPSYNPAGGGGGAGGYIAETGPTIGLAANSYTVTIGAGGNGAGSPPTSNYASSGTETTLISPTYTLIAYGGGQGGGYPTSELAETGGSGGGGGGYFPTMPKYGADGISGQGNPGGRAINNSGAPGPIYGVASGGGGGAGSAGGNGVFYPGPSTPLQYGRAGQGGDGIRNPAFVGSTLQPHIPPATIPPNTWMASGPTTDYWAGGGAGGYSGPSYGVVNRGGYGGGGNSGPYPPSGWPSSVTPDSPSRSTVPVLPTLNPAIPQNGGQFSGGGGGGGNIPQESGSGGSGVLMIRYAAPASA